MVDLSELSAIEVDPEARTAWAQAGLTTRAHTAAVQARGLVTGFGDTASVGVSGLTLGGEVSQGAVDVRVPFFTPGPPRCPGPPPGEEQGGGVAAGWECGP